LNLRRFARQARLEEVGEAGQRAIVAARFVVGSGGLAYEVAGLYLERAGATVLAARRESENVVEVVSDASLALAPGAADVGSGALAALVELRAVLGLGARGARLRDT
jgi:hypothetical protein